jgi:DNA invertase Pin-like site-specific DNA recombinase
MRFCELWHFLLWLGPRVSATDNDTSRCTQLQATMYTRGVSLTNAEPIALAYVRVSTARQTAEGHSIESQTRTLADAATARGFRVEIVADEGKSGGKVSNRPGLRSALDRLDRGDAAALFALDLDRLSRSVADFARILDRATRKGWAVVVLGMGAVDTTTPEGRLVAHMLAAAAQYEREMISKRVVRQHEQRRASGIVWGRDMGARSQIPADVHLEIADRHVAGESLRAIAADLNARSVPTTRGGAWYASSVRHALSSPSCPCSPVSS